VSNFISILQALAAKNFGGTNSRLFFHTISGEEKVSNINTCPLYYQTLVTTDALAKQARAFVASKFFKSILIFVSKARGWLVKCDTVWLAC